MAGAPGDAAASGNAAALAFVEQALERVNASHNVRQAIPFTLVRAMAVAAARRFGLLAAD